MEWDAQTALNMRSSGASWDDIGKQFGVTGTTVRRRVDSAYAIHRREQVNARRGKHEVHNTHRVRRMLPAVDEDEPAAAIPGRYTVFVPNRIALGLPMSAKGEGSYITLPWVSLLAKPLEKLSPLSEAGQ